MKDIRISVIVPIYNMENYIKRCIDSLLKQTFKNMEILLIDDGSTDACPLICDQYAQEHDMVYAFHKKNGGLSSARNYGLNQASGEYVVFADPDDWVDSDYLQNFVELQKKYPKSLPTVGVYISTIENEKPCIQYPQIMGFEGEGALIALMRSDFYCGFTVNKLYDMCIIKKNDLRFDVELGAAQDLFFNYEYICLCESVIYDSAPKYHYFQHEGGVTNSPITPRKLSGFKTYDKIIARAKEEYPRIETMARCTQVNLALSMLEKYYQTQNDNKETLRIIRSYIQKGISCFMMSKYHSLARKVQAIIAIVSGKGYYELRKRYKAKG